MLNFLLSMLCALAVMWVVVTLWFGVEFALFLRAVNRQSEGLRLAPLRDREHDRKLY